MGMPETKAELQTTYFWMAIMGVQIPFQVLILLLSYFVFVEEPLDFLVKLGDKQQAMKLIAKIYAPENQTTHEMIYREKEAILREQASGSEGEETVWKAITDER